MKFRKKPVVIEAIQFTGKNIDEIWKFIGAPFKQCEDNKEQYWIPTLEGPHRASKGDWIIKGIKGEFYPCKPDIFEQTYDKNDDDELIKEHPGLKGKRIKSNGDFVFEDGKELSVNDITLVPMQYIHETQLDKTIVEKAIRYAKEQSTNVDDVESTFLEYLGLK